MKRTKKKAVPEKPEKTLRMYTPERAAALVRLNKALWEDIGRTLRAMLFEISTASGGGEAPIIQCRARVKLMLGARRAMQPDFRRLVGAWGDEDEPWRWQDEFEQAMERWLRALEHDVEEYGATAVDGDDDEGNAFPPGFASALERLREAYDDWTRVASQLAVIDAPSGFPEGEIKKCDVQLKRIERRTKARRAAARKEPKRRVS